jgi:nucleotide-binding universal stress UspA family protein
MNILLFVSGLPYAKPAILFGGMLARYTKASVTLLHLVHKEEDIPVGESVLEEARELLPEVTVKTNVQKGRIPEDVLAEIRRGGYDLVVMRARRALRLHERLRGKIGRRVAAEAPVSVLVVKKETTSLKRVLICSGGQEVSIPVVETGARLTQAAQGQATLLHVANPIPSMYTGLHGIEETLPEMLQTNTPIARNLRQAAEILARYRLTAKLKLRHGVVADEILQESQSGHYDLIVVGAPRGNGKLFSLALTDVAQEVVNHSPCPVLVVRSTLAGVSVSGEADV